MNTSFLLKTRSKLVELSAARRAELVTRLGAALAFADLDTVLGAEGSRGGIATSVVQGVVTVGASSRLQLA